MTSSHNTFFFVEKTRVSYYSTCNSNNLSATTWSINMPNRLVIASSLLLFLSEIIRSSHFMSVHSLSSSPTTPPKYFIGFDLGTSGGRISIISRSSTNTINKQQHSTTFQEVYNDSIQYTKYDDPQSWNTAIQTLLEKTPSELLQNTKAICVSGTSASCLLVDSLNGGKVTRRPKMYDYDITNQNDDIDPTAHIHVQESIEKYVPKDHATRANTSTLSKLLHYHYCQSIAKNEVLVHQSEYVANTMFLSNPKQCGAGEAVNSRTYVSDWHNALKLGYDVRTLSYPKWLLDCLTNELGLSTTGKLLPKVVAPGEVIQTISTSCSNQFGIHPDAVVVGGTTDSNAAFIAATASSPDGGGVPTYGTAVTSLGSTLAIKMLSKTYVEDASQGVYSHRFPVFGGSSSSSSRGNSSSVKKEKKDEEEAWLVGGASNVGCAILRKENFSNTELVTLSNDMDVMVDSEVEYYPLTKRGERFPIADSTKEPILNPKPDSRGEYLKGILQGISNVEKKGFEVLGELGSSPSYPDVVWTCGGGSKNDKWIQMRQRILEEGGMGAKKDDAVATTGVKVLRANNAEASFGAAVLAASSFST